MNKVVAWAGGITTVAGAVGVIFTVYNRMPIPDSIEEWHHQTQIVEDKELNEAIGMITALTIPPLLKVTCDDPQNFPMRELLAKRLALYKDKMGFEYSVPPCPDPDD